jgi:trk system potassium uptake protein TrkH
VYVVAVLLALPFGLALFDDEARSARAYGAAVVVALATAGLMRALGGPASELHRKDAFGVVSLTWVVVCGLGALPMVLEGAIPDPFGALFESVSGFTTTGATVVADVDRLSRATNLWRCLMHWIGGMGIVVLFVAVFPQLGVGAKQLFKAEVPGLPSDGLRPRIRETALRLWWVYAGLTAACCGLLRWFGMSWFDAICHAFSTLGSGGFSTRTASVGAWDDPRIHWTIAVFMLLAGLNFGLYYGLLKGRVREVLRNTELRFYLLLNLVITGVVAAALAPTAGLSEGTVRESAFQVLAVTTTTGFMTADFDAYPPVARMLLLLAMFVGGCAGSTAGGLKAARVLLLSRIVEREVLTTAQPRAVITVRLGGVPVPETVLNGVLVFAAAYLGLCAVTAAALAALGVEPLTAISGTVTCLSSVGPGLGGLGPTQNFGWIPAPGKLLLCLCMLAGRLEIFALFAILTPEVWRR